MHLKRLITAAIILPLLYLYIAKLPPYFFAGLISVAALIALWEFLTMYRAGGAVTAAAMALGAVIVASTALTGSANFEIFAPVFLVVAVLRLFARPPAQALKETAVPLVALIYIPGLVTYQMLLREHGPEWILFLYGTVWAADSFAFYVGSTIGRHKLYPAVSPNKTVEGGAGSVVGALLAALLLKLVLSIPLSLPQTAFAGLVLGTTAVMGDLVESMFKRDSGVKDSSHLIPGHGGILDKMDGSLFSAPVLYWMLLGFGAAA
jgi:phosphatidate cytidylyltransferase